MSLTDQQLRQELLKYGETVPPITQRNRQQLRDRLEILRSRPRSPVKATSPTRSRASTRSRPTRGLIELSDSETDTSSNEYPTATRSFNKSSNIQTRSIAVGRDTDRATSPNVTADVEESIQRHRREIQQLIDSARDRARAAGSTLSSQYQSPSSSKTPIRPSTIPSRSRSEIKSNIQKPTQPSWLNRSKQAIQTFWKQNNDKIINLLKSLIIGSIVGGILIVTYLKAKEIIPHRQGITCTPDNATECQEMIPLVDSLRNYLRVRTGEVDCGFRPKHERYVSKPEIHKYLDNNAFKFEHGNEARWDTLITYILDKPVEDILVLDNQHKVTNVLEQATKLTAIEGYHSLTCRLRKGASSAMQHLAWVSLGTLGFLTLGWAIKRRFRKHQESENTYKDVVEKILNLLETQYEEHLQDSDVKPWLAITHVRDMLIPPQDRKRLNPLWERATKYINEKESRVRSESQLIHGEEYDVWRWIQPRSPSPTRKKRSESPASSNEESYVYMPSDVGLTQCLKLRSFFDPDTLADDDEIDLVVDSIQNRCATVRRIEHIGIHANYVYLKFSSKEAAAQGFHLLNSWKYHGREIIAKYLRLERYYEHFPEARESGS